MFLQFIELSPVDVMRLSLGAWLPEGRSSSSVSQFLPSCSWSACQMAVWWKDGYRGDLSPWLFLQLCFCSVWGRCPAERGGQTQRCAQLSARLSAELCSPDLWRYYTTLRCTESIHFLWSPKEVSKSWHGGNKGLKKQEILKRFSWENI